MKTIVVMPAYNAENTLDKTLSEIPYDYVDEIILVDDFSIDNTINLAKSLSSKYSNKPFTIIARKQNDGYGANQKDCYAAALAHGAEIIIMLHPDYQYDPKLIRFMKLFIEEGYFDVVLGSRIRSRRESLEGGMPMYKYFANRFLSFIQNIISGQNFSEWHTGMRAYKRKVIETIKYEDFSNNFVFDTQMLFAIVEQGYRVGDIPVPVRYLKGSSSISFFSSVSYGLSTLFEMVKFLNRKIFGKIKI